MTSGQFTIRAMTRREVDVAVGWAADEGWNPGLYDAQAFYNTDPDGFFIGLLDGEPVASISAVTYGHAYGFMGFYIVKPDHRHRGYGRRIWLKALEYLGHGIIGLDGVVAEVDNYRRDGFEEAFRSVRYQSVGGGDKPKGVVDLNELPRPIIEAYDAGCFPAPRPAFIRGWINMPGSAAWGVVADGFLGGYGVIRPCRKGYKIGPLFADTVEIAETLYLALASHAPGQPVFLDVPHNNSLAVGLAKRHSMEPVFETARMYKNGHPPWNAEAVFGITTFELG